MSSISSDEDPICFTSKHFMSKNEFCVHVVIDSKLVSNFENNTTHNVSHWQITISDSKYITSLRLLAILRDFFGDEAENASISKIYRDKIYCDLRVTSTGGRHEPNIEEINKLKEILRENDAYNDENHRNKCDRLLKLLKH